MMSIQIDSSAWPLVVLTAQPPLHEPGFAAYLEALERLLARRQRHVYIFDASQVRRVPAQICQRQAAWIGAHREELRRLCAGMAFWIPNATVRLALSLIFAIQAAPYPYAVCCTREEAAAWAQGHLHP